MRHARNKAARGRLIALALIVTAGVLGSILVGVGVRGEAPPPSPPASEALDAGSASAAPTSRQPRDSTPAPSAEPSRTAEPAPPVAAPELILDKSQPTRLSIPSIDVDTDLMNVGLQADGTIGVPPLLADSPAGWYDRGPSPGEQGPAVILGHVTALNQEGPAVFFKLGALRKGDEASVTRADGTVAVFTVTRVVQTPKPDFSTMDTYGNTDDAQLRLITCGGTFDESTGRHADNIVVHAELTSTREA
ncbi:class F sortase [Zhihengliuella salsuginis]|uniref:Class F sortase n=1 Tax=Zhihengliuella salsuginis TaxID=578222 RepID=A0ABQ3GA03_9MICC|nr:class F sortase [Zhihengliuella salsuginis]GHC99320.1 class F sortase [Zhihengliuella salsuginis]